MASASAAADDDQNGTNKQLHIAMFPWLAFGHMIPWLELAKLIAHHGHSVTFISSPRNIHRLPKIPASLSSSLRFVALPLPQIDGLPPSAEATTDLPQSQIQYLKKSLDSLQEPLAQLLGSIRPDWIFYDFVQYWAGSVASRAGVKSCFFSIFVPAFLGFLGPPSVLADGGERSPEDFTVVPGWVDFPTGVKYKIYEIRDTFECCVDDEASGINDLVRVGLAARNCDIVVVRSCADFDSDWLRVLRKIYGKPVVPVGQLRPADRDDVDDSLDNEWKRIKQWLDEQDRGSVVYVAFGSEAKPNQKQVTELALGIEESGFPFFWVLKTRRGEYDTNPIELPPGFEQRTAGRGIVRTSWVPQLKILGHDSVGGFLTHSGWSSVVEAISFGRPLILLTFYSDQGINARVLEERKLGYCIPRDESDGSFSSDSVAESLRVVMVSEEGKVYRENVKEMSGVFGDRERQKGYVDELLAHLLPFKFAANKI